METTTISVGRWRVNAARAARPGAPRLVLNAPWPLTLQSFEAVWPRLTAHFDVTAVDLPGFGASPLAADVMRPRAMADFFEALLEEVVPEGAHLVALDVGVPAALAYAARGTGRLRSLTLSDGPGTGEPALQPGLQRMVDSSFFRWLYSLSPRVFVRLAAKDGYQRISPPSSTITDALEAHSRPGMLRGTLSFLGSYPAELPAIEAGLCNIDVPTLLLWGERDVFVPPENAERIAAHLKDAQIVRLPEAGHFSHDDDVEGYVEALRAFVERVETMNGASPADDELAHGDHPESDGDAGARDGAGAGADEGAARMPAEAPTGAGLADRGGSASASRVAPRLSDGAGAGVLGDRGAYLVIDGRDGNGLPVDPGLASQPRVGHEASPRGR